VDLSRSASFPFISSNLVDQESGKRFSDLCHQGHRGSKNRDLQPTLPNFFSAESDPRIRGISLRPPLEEAKHIIGKLRPEADLVVLLSHLGYTADIELAETLPGIDVIVGGHSGRSLLPDADQGHDHCPGGIQGASHVGELQLKLAPDRRSRPDSSLKAAIPLSPSDKQHHGIAEMVQELQDETLVGVVQSGRNVP